MKCHVQNKTLGIFVRGGGGGVGGWRLMEGGKQQRATWKAVVANDEELVYMPTGREDTVVTGLFLLTFFSPQFVAHYACRFGPKHTKPLRVSFSSCSFQ